MTARSRLPLNALRVFDAAARHGRFDKAADELSITPGAVSRQIKALEADLGVRLFDRFNRAVRLTEAGQRLAAGVAEGLERIEQAVGAVRPRPGGPLVVSVLHSLAVKWLVPRLQRFYALYPSAEVLIEASDRAVDLARGEADIAIRYGPGPYPGFVADRLLAGELFPVCSPRLLETHPLNTPSDLAGVTLLHDSNFLPDEPLWRDWLDVAGAKGVDAERGPRFSNTYLQLEAATSGTGVVLTHRPYVFDDLRAGRLVRPFPQTIPSPYHYWALCLPERAGQPAIRRFCAWLKAEAEADLAAGIG